MTSNYLLDRMDQVTYEEQVLKWKIEVDRVVILPELEIGDDQRSIVKAASDTTITFREDLRLMLLKHWNLYDAMFHSTYVATKLGIWREKGRKKLTNMLVKMGFFIKLIVGSRKKNLGRPSKK